MNAAAPDVEIPDAAMAPDALFGTMYAELHRLARRELNRRGRIGGLGVTTLLHQVYLSISATEGAVFVDHARFMAYAARVMRGLIIDGVRRRRSEKRGGLFHITSLDTDHADSVSSPQTLILTGDALEATSATGCSCPIPPTTSSTGDRRRRRGEVGSHSAAAPDAMAGQECC